MATEVSTDYQTAMNHKSINSDLPKCDGAIHTGVKKNRFDVPARAQAPELALVQGLVPLSLQINCHISRLHRLKRNIVTSKENNFKYDSQPLSDRPKYCGVGGVHHQGGSSCPLVSSRLLLDEVRMMLLGCEGES